MQLPHTSVGVVLTRPTEVGRMLKALAPPKVDPVPVDIEIPISVAEPIPADPVFNITINVNSQKEEGPCPIR